MKRILWIAAVTIVIVACAAPFLPLNFLRPSLEQALARRLGRRVEIDEVSLTLFTGPGFALSGVMIHEDARAGIEPFAYAQTVDANVDLLALIAGRRGFSSLRFKDATLNLVRTDAGQWNFQYLNEARLADAPAVHLRRARVNLKFGQTKSLLYFDDVDLDVSPGNQGSLALGFSGVPERTDRPAQGFGHLFVTGSWIPSSDRPLSLKVELEPSSFDGMAKQFGRTWFDLQGQVSLNAQLSGLPSLLAVVGDVELDEGRRSDFLPNRDAKWKLPYRGTLDLTSEKLNLENVRDAKTEAPLTAHLEAANLLTSPQWRASVELKGSPVSVVIDAARRVGVPVPEKLSADGVIEGHLEYDSETGVAGTVEARDVAVRAPGSPEVKAATLPVKIAEQVVAMGPVMLSLGDSGSAQAEVSYKFDGSMASDVKLTARAVDLLALRAFASAPILDRVVFDSKVVERRGGDPKASEQKSPGESAPAEGDSSDFGAGMWRGSIRYQRKSGEEGAWTGDYTVENARIAIDGVADPIHVQFAAVSSSPVRLAVTRIKAKAGDVSFAGEYHWNAPGAAKAGDAKVGDLKLGEANDDHPHKFKVQIAEASATELARLFKPSLGHGAGIVQRTARNAPPGPDSLAQRRAEGTVAITGLKVGEQKFAVDSAQVIWDGASVLVSPISARSLDTAGSLLKGAAAIDLSQADGRLVIDLTGRGAPVHYKGSVVGSTASQ